MAGLFHTRFVPAFPTTSQTFTVYAALNGAQGEGIMHLLVTSLETEKDIYSYKKWFVAADPDTVINVEIKVRRCSFPVSGRYGFSFRMDGEEISHRTLTVLLDREN